MAGTAAAAAGALLALGAGTAAAFSCAPNGTVVEVTAIDETVTIAKGNLSRITVNGVDCGLTTSSASAIRVLGTAQDASPDMNVVVDMGGGRFEPGSAGPPEGTGLNEVEIVLRGVFNTLTILGNAAPDTIQLGQAGDFVDADGDGLDEVGIVNLNGDDDADV